MSRRLHHPFCTSKTGSMEWPCHSMCHQSWKEIQSHMHISKIDQIHYPSVSKKKRCNNVLHLISFFQLNTPRPAQNIFNRKCRTNIKYNNTALCHPCDLSNNWKNTSTLKCAKFPKLTTNKLLWSFNSKISFLLTPNNGYVEQDSVFFLCLFMDNRSKRVHWK